ncbi:MAG TPA: peptidylprolyl isomerase [Burkholderiales bacterium]|nr:peptidylprolyl isomerase [Burkholderiales bacterium]
MTMASRFPLIAALLLATTAAAQAPAGGGAPAAPVPVDRIVAVVNDEAITRTELTERAAIIERQLRQQGVALPPKETFEKQVLERLIIDRAQLQFANETGLRVDDAQLDRALRRIAEDNKLSIQQLREAVEKDGVPFAKFREQVRSEIILSRLREREVENRVVVSDAEIDQYLATQEAQAGKSVEYSISHILVRVPEQASPEQIQAQRRRADQALAEVRSGKDFAQVAAAFSDAPDGLQGGNMGWRAPARLPAIFAEVAEKMRPGEVSAVLRSPAGFHIVKLVDKRGADAAVAITQTHARHILIKTSELVSEADARNRLIQLKERIENGASFADLARLQSEDGSAANGGDLGWVSPGDTVPEFERAMDALRPNQISDPVQSPFGWHLIQVLERRTQDVTKDRQRLVARQAIRARKADEAYQEWLRQLRDRAYVEIRLEER